MKILREYINLLLEEDNKTITVFHASPELSLTRLVPKYSPKFQEKGIFVSPNMRAIRESWASYVTYKKGTAFSNKGDLRQDGYKSIAVYTLRILRETLEQAKKEHWEQYEQAKKRIADKYNISKEDAAMKLFGAWGWDSEIFIPEHLMKYIEVSSVKKYNPNELMKRKEPITNVNKGKDQTEEFAKEVRWKNPAADYWLKTKEKLLLLSLAGKDIKEQIPHIQRELGALVKFFEQSKIIKPYGQKYANTETIWFARKQKLTSKEKQEINKIINSIESLMPSK